MPAVKQSFSAQPIIAAAATADAPVKSGFAAATPPTLPLPLSSPPHLDIIDIRHQHAEFNLKQEIVKHLNPVRGPPTLPTLLLYDDKGLQLFEQITYLDEYYLTNYEIELLRKHAMEMASLVPAGAIVVELGSGNLRKVSLLLDAFERLEKPIDYYALDLLEQELRRTLLQVPQYTHVRCHGLVGTYDDGKDWLRRITADEAEDRTVCILQLGSSIGNFSRDEAVEFLQGFAQVLRPSDSILIGVDSCCDPEKV